MNSRPESVTVEVPTLLGRASQFVDLFILSFAALTEWYLFNMHHPWWGVPVLLLLVPEILTGEAAGDVPFLGAIAAACRSKLGLRRAHEWLLAAWHYVQVRVWPDFQVWSETTWQNSRLRSALGPTQNYIKTLWSASSALWNNRRLRFWKAS